MISVCIATHNGERYIKEQLDSILIQLTADDEVIVSDDGSSDSTLEIIKSYDDPRISIYEMVHSIKGLSPHKYTTRNFENALIRAKGDYIFLSDQDDYWMPDKVEKCVKALDTYGVVVHNMRIADGDLNDSGENFYSKNTGRKFRMHNYLMIDGMYFGCAMAFHRKVLNRALPFPKKLGLHDFWIGMIGEFFWGVKYIDEPLILYRFRLDSVSHSVKNSLVHKVTYRLYVMSNLIFRIIRTICK